MKRFLAAFVRWHTHPRAFSSVAVGFVAWMVAGEVTRLDRYPFPFLTAVVSLWAILLSMATLDRVDETHERVHREDD